MSENTEIKYEYDEDDMIDFGRCTECGSDDVTDEPRNGRWADNSIPDEHLTAGEMSDRLNGYGVVDCTCNKCGHTWDEM